MGRRFWHIRYTCTVPFSEFSSTNKFSIIYQNSSIYIIQNFTGLFKHIQTLEPSLIRLQQIFPANSIPGPSVKHREQLDTVFAKCVVAIKIV